MSKRSEQILYYTTESEAITLETLDKKMDIILQLANGAHLVASCKNQEDNHAAMFPLLGCVCGEITRIVCDIAPDKARTMEMNAARG